MKDVTNMNGKEEFASGMGQSKSKRLAAMRDVQTMKSMGECVGCMGKVALLNQFTEGLPCTSVWQGRLICLSSQVYLQTLFLSL